jgi:hypothetical protein
MDTEVVVLLVALQALQLAQSAVLGRVVRKSLRPPPQLRAAAKRPSDDDTPED